MYNNDENVFNINAMTGIGKKLTVNNDTFGIIK